LIILDDYFSLIFEYGAETNFVLILKTQLKMKKLIFFQTPKPNNCIKINILMHTITLQLKSECVLLSKRNNSEV